MIWMRPQKVVRFRLVAITSYVYVVLSVLVVLTLGVTPLSEPPPASLAFFPLSPPLVSSEKLAKEKFLVAANHLHDPNFSQTVIYLIAYGQWGALGVVVNRPTDIHLASALPRLADQPHAEDVIYAGGPVGRTRMLLLVRSQTSPLGDTLPITEEVSVTSSLAHLTELAATGTAQFHVYAGHAGWAPLQLDSEVARGDWHVVSGHSTTLFDTDLKNVWSDLSEKKDTHDATEWINNRQSIYPKPSGPLLMKEFRRKRHGRDRMDYSFIARH